MVALHMKELPPTQGIVVPYLKDGTESASMRLA